MAAGDGARRRGCRDCRRRGNERRYLKAAVRRFVFIALALSCAGCESAIPDAKTSDDQLRAAVAPAHLEERDLTAAERSILADSFASNLSEPESAKFRWAKVPKVSIGPSFEYCGMVNVKNSNGSYDGMQPFLGTITTSNGNITGGAIAAINTGTPLYNTHHALHQGIARRLMIS
jgi:hypothetical protein